MASNKQARNQAADGDGFFNEVHSKYFRIVEKILLKAQQGSLQRSDIDKMVCSNGFGESNMYIPEKLKTEAWPFLLQDKSTQKMSTLLKNDVGTPLTLLEKRWLKTLLLDPRIKLFDVDATGLEDLEPLFNSKQFVYFDQYTDGDDYNDEAYQQHFKTLLQACEQKQLVEIGFTNNKGEKEKHVYLPFKLEYSTKDDKFRLRAERQPEADVTAMFSLVNLGSIFACRLLEKQGGEAVNHSPKRSTIVLELTDERNALERALLHFSGLKKETQKLDDKHYRIKLTFRESDRAELIIRVLSFGPVIRLVRPELLQDKSLVAAQTDFWKELRSRLNKQRELLREMIEAVVMKA